MSGDSRDVRGHVCLSCAPHHPPLLPGAMATRRTRAPASFGREPWRPAAAAEVRPAPARSGDPHAARRLGDDAHKGAAGFEAVFMGNSAVS